MDTAKDLLSFKFQNQEVRIQNLMMQLENFFLNDPEARLKEPSQFVYLLFRFQKMYEMWIEQFEVKEKILFPFFSAHFPKRDRELIVLGDQMRELHKKLKEFIVLIDQTFLKESLSENEISQRVKKIANDGREITLSLKKYFESESYLLNQELFGELREDEAEVFFRKVVQLQNDRLNLKGSAYRRIPA